MKMSEKPFPIPTAFSTAVMMVIAVISAIVVFMWHFMAQANDLKLEQQNLRDFAAEVGDQVNENTVKLDVLAQQVHENTMKLDDLVHQVNLNIEKTDNLVQEFDSLQSSIMRLVCNSNPELEDCAESPTALKF